MRILVTGGCGFIGSNFIRYILQHYKPAYVTNVDALTYAGNLANLDGVFEEHGERYEFFKADIANADQMDALMTEHRFYAVINFAHDYQSAPRRAAPGLWRRYECARLDSCDGSLRRDCGRAFRREIGADLQFWRRERNGESGCGKNDSRSFGQTTQPHFICARQTWPRSSVCDRLFIRAAGIELETAPKFQGRHRG